MVGAIMDVIIIMLMYFATNEIRNYVIDIAMDQYKRDKIIIEQIQSMLDRIVELEKRNDRNV
jgi:hypothetical protein